MDNLCNNNTSINNSDPYENQITYDNESNSKEHDGAKNTYEPAIYDTTYSSIPIGFKNPQLYCYLNSVLQMLYSCGSFRKFLISVHQMNIKNITGYKRDAEFVIDLAELFLAIQKCESDLVQVKVLTVQKYFQCGDLGDDVHKCFLNILKSVNNGLQAMSETVENSNECFEACDLFKMKCDYFSFCKMCTKEHYRKSQTFLSFPLTVPKTDEISIEKCIDAFLEKTTLDENIFNCCDSLSIEMQFEFQSMPKYVFIYLIRGSYHGSQFKNNTFVDINDGIIIGKKGGSTCFYRLKLVIEHIGNAMAGHYYVKSLVKEKWWKISDYHKEKINSSEVITHNTVGILLELLETSDDIVDPKPNNGVDENLDKDHTSEIANNGDNIVDSKPDNGVDEKLDKDHTSEIENDGIEKETEKETEDDEKTNECTESDPQNNLDEKKNKQDDDFIFTEIALEPISGTLVLNDQLYFSKIPDENCWGILSEPLTQANLITPINSIITLSLCLRELWDAILECTKKSQKQSNLINNLCKEFQQINSYIEFPKLDSNITDFQSLFNEGSWGILFSKYMDLCVSNVKEQNENCDLIDSEYVKIEKCTKCNLNNEEFVKRKLVSITMPQSDYGTLEEVVGAGFKSEIKMCETCNSKLNTKLILNRAGKYVFIHIDRGTVDSWNNCSIFPEEAYIIPVGAESKLFLFVAVMDLLMDKNGKIDYVIKSYQFDKWQKIIPGSNLATLDDFEIITNRSVLLVLQSTD